MSLIVALLTGLAGSPIHGQPSPTIEIIEGLSGRLLHTDVEWIDPVQGLMQVEAESPLCTTDFNGRCTDSNPYQQGGEWDATTSASGPSVSATAWQHSTVGDHSIHGWAQTEVDSTLGKSAEASSNHQVSFWVAPGTDFQLRVYFTFRGSFAVNGTAVGYVWVNGADPSFGGVHTVQPGNVNTWVVEYDGWAGAGGQMTLMITAAASQPGTEATATSLAEVSYALHFGVAFSDGFESGTTSAW